MAENKTPGLGERLAFACPELSITLAFATTNSWYLFFLVEAVGLHPLAAGTAFALGRFIDGFLDPAIGSLSDRLTPRKGRKFLPKLAIVPAAALFSLMWQVPLWTASDLGAFLAATIGFSIFALCYTMISVPRLAMLPAFDPRPEGRTTQIAIDTVFIFLSVFAATSLLPLILGTFWSSPNIASTPKAAWAFTALMISAIMVCAYTIFLLKVPDQRTTNTNSVGVSLKTSIFRALSAPDFRWPLIAFFFSVVTLISVQATLPFLLEKRIGLSASEQSLALAIVFVVALSSFPGWVMLAKWFPKAKCLQIGSLPYMCFLAMIAVTPAGNGMTFHVIAGCILCGLGLAALSIFPWSIMPDVVSSWNLNVKEELTGTATALFTLSNKIAGATGVFGVSIVLSLVSTEGTVTSALLMIAIPSVSLVLMLLSANKIGK